MPSVTLITVPTRMVASTIQKAGPLNASPGAVRARKTPAPAIETYTVSANTTPITRWSRTRRRTADSNCTGPSSISAPPSTEWTIIAVRWRPYGPTRVARASAT